MGLGLQLKIKNNYITLNFDKETPKFQKYICDRLVEKLNPFDPARFHSSAFTKYHSWDGRITIFDRKKLTVPTGLYEELISVLKEIQDQGHLDVQELDLQGPAIKPKVPSKEELTMTGEGVKTLVPRDKQYTAVQAVINKQRGILLDSMNFGKSYVAYASMYLLLPKLSKFDKALFIAPNKSIMNQMYKNFDAYLDDDIGIWGNGQKELEPKLICATIQTIASAIKRPEVKLSKKADKLLERLVTVHAPHIISNSTPRNNLKLYARNFIPKYKYEYEDQKELKMLANTLQSNREVKKFFKDQQKEYDKLLLSKDRKGFKKYNEALELLDSVKVVFADECQSAKANSYQKVFGLLENARIRIGMSGTIETTKHDSYYLIKGLLEKPIHQATNNQLIEAGFSAKPHIQMLSFNKPADLERQVQHLIEINRIPKYQQALYRYQQSYRIGVIENEERNRLISQLAIKLSHKKEKMATFIMVNSLEHGENIEQYLKSSKVPYAYVQGSDNNEIREAVLDKVRAGKIKILIATKIFDAGIDVPNLKYFISCSGGKSYVQNLQRIGRLLRTQKDKHDVYIFDIMDRNSEYLFKQSQERIKYYKNEGFEIKY